MESTTKTTMQEKRLETAFKLARGPLLVTVVTASMLLPYLQEYLTWYLLVHLTLISVGIACCLQDFWEVASATTKALCNKLLDSIVLDDFLKSIYDPESGWIACWTGMFVGSSTMYGLKMSEEHKVSLLQSTLAMEDPGIDEDTTRTILMEPGGTKALLPESMQQWLAEDDDAVKVHNNNNKGTHSSVPDVDVSIDHTPSTVSFDMTEMEGKDDFVFDGETVQKARGLHFHNEHEEDAEVPQRSHNNNDKQQQSRSAAAEPSEVTNPVSVFVTILKDLAVEQIKPYAEAFPRSKAESIGTAAVTLQVVMLILSRRRRGNASHMWKRLFAVAMSSVAVTSFGSVLVQEAILGRIHDRQSLQLACRGIMQRVLSNIKGRVLSSKTKSFLAMAVLLVLGRKPNDTNTNGKFQ